MKAMLTINVLISTHLTKAWTVSEQTAGEGAITTIGCHKNGKQV